MRYRHETANCLTAAIGPAGLTPALLEATLAELAGALARLRDEAAKGSRPYLALPAAQQDLPRIREVAQRLRAFDDVLVLATGGSSLGGQSLHALADRSQARASTSSTTSMPRRSLRCSAGSNPRAPRASPSPSRDRRSRYWRSCSPA